MTDSGLVLFLVFFVSMWLAISYLVAAVGGRRTLAIYYRSPDHPVGGRRFFMRSARMRLGSGYSSCLNLAVDSAGVYLSVFPLFRFGHPRLFIPWSDLSATRRRRWLMDAVELHFAKAPGVPLILSRRLGASVLEGGPVQVAAA